MKKVILVTIVIFSVLLMGSFALGNPALLPKHPGYPMGATKDPVLGVPTANDPGRAAPPAELALEQAAMFHDAQAINPSKEYRPNVVYEEEKQGSGASTNIKKGSGR